VFVADITADGRVAIKDKPNFWIKLNKPCISCIGRSLGRWAEDPRGHASRDERAVETRTVTILNGGFDLTDWAMRRSGQDPYSARKLAFMNRTREQRAGMAATYKTESIRDSVAHLSRNLSRIWEYQSWTPARRRRVIFQLWDECAEKGTQEVLRASATARATIISFIRRTLPAGSRHAYTATELQALNAKRSSRARFAPY
jgi:hypothetical protein